MSKMIKSMSLVILILMMSFGLVACQRPEKGDKIEVTVALYQGDKVFEDKYLIEENSSVYELLELYFEGTYTSYGEDKFVNTLKINTVELIPVGQQFIAFYVNGESSMVGVSSYYLKDNDLIELKLESWG